MTKTIIYISVLLMTILILSSVAFAAESSDSGKSTAEGKNVIAARVNGKDISLNSVEALADRMFRQRVRGHGDPQIDPSRIRKEAIDRLIFEELALQAAKHEGMKVDPADLEKRIADLISSSGGDDAFQKTLRERKLTEGEVRNDLSRSILLQNIFKKEIIDKTPPISDAEIEKAYEQQKDQFIVAEKIIVTDTVLFLSREDSGSADKAERVRMKILSDKDHDPMNLVPDGTFIVRELEVKKDKQPEIYAAAAGLKIGELSSVFATSDSMHIIKIREHIPEKRFTLSQMKGYLESTLTAAARKKRMHEWEADLRNNAKIEITDAGR